MVYAGGNDPQNATLKTGAIVKGPGKLITMDGANNTIDLAAVGEIAIGVSAGDSSRTAAGTLDAAAGATASYYPMGGVLMVQSAASMPWTTGLLVYATNLGLATTSSGSSAKVIGTYVGEGVVTGGALVANGNSDSEQTDGATLLLSEGTMIPVNTNGAVTA